MGRIIEVTQGTDAWHQFRILGIGASDAPVVEGVSPYRTKRQLYFEKKGKPVAEDDDAGKDFIFGQGHKVESIIRKEFQDLVGVEMNPVCMIHDKIDFIRASLDGFHPSKGVLEAKLVGKEVLQKALDGEIPTHHFSQIQHQLLVTGADIAQWYGHDGKKNGALVEVRRNEDYIKHLVYAETNFWEDVQAGRVPALSEMDYLEPENTVLLQELRELKELAENAKAQYESLKENIVNVYHHNRIAGAGVKLFKTQRQGTLNVMNIPEISKAVAEAKAKLTEEYIESFRGKGTEVWNIKIT